MAIYEVTTSGLELPRGKRFSVHDSPVAAGDLCLCKVGKIRIVGRWFPGWILQPGRWVRITGEATIKGLDLR